MNVDREQISKTINNAIENASTRAVRGEVASYIPELAKANPQKAGIAVTLSSGDTFGAGDFEDQSTIQSVSKVFTLAMALGTVGDGLWSRVGREPSGSAFDSILQLEHERGIPRNPFVNAGAIVVTDEILANYQPKEALGEIVRFARSLAQDDTIHIDKAVARSETQTGHRNRALANYLLSFNNLRNEPDLTLGVYYHQCALSMSCAQLSRAGRFLAFGGGLGTGGAQIVAKKRAKRIAAIMLTCGHYDGSGDFAYRVGVPAKSGVSGMILAIVPNVASIAVWSPGLDKQGNSLIGTQILEEVVEALDWSIF
ncbi:glutaminase [Maritalea porphyrae]|uniref:Glutaminase n=1 Tax=Maritalea porphyrae TaxID=880732 RepID=A0ABQ5US39_9HYPH|nr:glutaminase [Maritalea porphyrae]GLQ17196.1 glutaminase [Maritalea porphyrae]